MAIRGVTPVLNVSHIGRSFKWFESLGWERGFSWNEGGMIGFGPEAFDSNEHGEADFASVCSGDATIFLCCGGQGARGDAATDGVWMSWWVDTRAEVDALYAAAVSNGMNATHPPTDEPWGAREFHLRHPDGHTFRVSASNE